MATKEFEEAPPGTRKIVVTCCYVIEEKYDKDLSRMVFDVKMTGLPLSHEIHHYRWREWCVMLQYF